MPTSIETLSRPRASVMIDLSKAGLNLNIDQGQVEPVDGEEARKSNHLIHLKYVTPDALDDSTVASYLLKGDDVTMKMHIDRLIRWNLNDSSAGQALRNSVWFHPVNY